MVAGKPDLTFGRFRFRCNFQTVRNLQKGTTEMSSGGPKLVEMSYMVAGNGRKWTEMAGKSQIFRWFTVAVAAASSARSRRVRRRFAVKFHRRDCLDVAHLLGRRVSPVADRWCLVWSDLSRLAIEQKAQFGSRFGELLPRVFGAQRVSWGIGFHLESQTMFI